MGEISAGMPVYDLTGTPLGPVEAADADSFRVAGQTVPRSAVARVANGSVYLLVAGTALAPGAGDPAATGTTDRRAATSADDAERTVIPIVEERIQIGTRQLDLGEIEIRKRIIEETRMMPVIVRREVVEIVRRDANGAEVSVEEVRPNPQNAPTA